MEMTFGKYKGKTIEEVFQINPTYFKWMNEKGLTNKLEYQEFIETIPYEFPEQFEWDIDIRDGYQCWKCQKPMKIFLMYNPEVENDMRESFPIISNLAYRKPKSIVTIAKEFGVLLEERYSKVVELKYVIHVCPHCKMHQGDNYVVEDNEQNTLLIKRTRIVFVKGSWSEC